jgi:hypothetical protein
VLEKQAFGSVMLKPASYGHLIQAQDICLRTRLDQKMNGHYYRKESSAPRRGDHLASTFRTVAALRTV